ncbi:hypothetical protein A3D80_04065 [Candidatus Roizmanbacteria bacterium RIFCSPHIGHO2_02_FULL_40_13b]|uniref:Uncharacterized protein n=1 Tax=Candidatus Roizmanbacteria bacterium RIFCSPHIGHO2_01_FULL_39_24 TaxID=1802032 RepID=A0A1F7GL67_9BACT|nr:MAG: hypothetical protein A2799_00360 [Candidatus Roizmanbacteria bacterium RIFCSPHIGHO2_01_FULL_39_24]OGK27968.1 MAG: hypothetical protein A3D80_04065 [Candidatus Roizmanbacteria bacterium RIFCSPHIGHO2_02_FULL_40_13b]OGK49240.1 MAG: hypothetical protein A3A56_04570 [Candidatus Roizmanbacteria bacterium RIFCSPLOWO2_01_FULL_40_32]
MNVRFFRAISVVVLAGFLALVATGFGTATAYAQSSPQCPRVEHRSDPFSPLKTTSGCTIVGVLNSISAHSVYHPPDRATHLVVQEHSGIWRLLAPVHLRTVDFSRGFLNWGDKGVEVLALNCATGPQFDRDFTLRFVGSSDLWVDAEQEPHGLNRNTGPANGNIVVSPNCVSVGDAVSPNLTPVPTPTPPDLDHFKGELLLIYSPACVMCRCPVQVAVVRNPPIALRFGSNIEIHGGYTCPDSVLAEAAWLVRNGAYPVAPEMLVRFLPTYTPAPSTTTTATSTRTPTRAPTQTSTRTSTPAPTTQLLKHIFLPQLDD